MTRVTVHLPPGCDALPARTYLIKHYGISNSQWKRLKHTGDFRRNGASLNATQTMVRNGDLLTFESEKPANPAAFPIEPQDLPLDIRYEDDVLLAVNKPAGQLVHPLTVEPTGTLANAVLSYYRRRGESHRAAARSAAGDARTGRTHHRKKESRRDGRIRPQTQERGKRRRKREKYPRITLILLSKSVFLKTKTI